MKVSTNVCIILDLKDVDELTLAKELDDSGKFRKELLSDEFVGFNIDLLNEMSVEELINKKTKGKKNKGKKSKDAKVTVYGYEGIGY